MNHFEFFEIDVAFDIDMKSLKRKYLLMQQKFHPDGAGGNSPNIESIEKSMQLNEAYKILLNDYSRASYLLEILGFAITEENSKNILPPKDLENIWNDNETLEEIDNLEKLYAFEKYKLQDQATLIEQLQAAFKKLLSNNHADLKEMETSITLETTIALTVKLKYLTNLVGNIRNKIKALSLSQKS